MKRSDAVRIIQVVLDSYITEAVEDSNFIADVILTDLEEIGGMIPPFEYDKFRKKMPEHAKNLDIIEADIEALHKWERESFIGDDSE